MAITVGATKNGDLFRSAAAKQLHGGLDGPSQAHSICSDVQRHLSGRKKTVAFIWRFNGDLMVIVEK